MKTLRIQKVKWKRKALLISNHIFKIQITIIQNQNIPNTIQSLFQNQISNLDNFKFQFISFFISCHPSIHPCPPSSSSSFISILIHLGSLLLDYIDSPFSFYLWLETITQTSSHNQIPSISTPWNPPLVDTHTDFFALILFQDWFNRDQRATTYMHISFIFQSFDGVIYYFGQHNLQQYWESLTKWSRNSPRFYWILKRE